MAKKDYSKLKKAFLDDPEMLKQINHEEMLANMAGGGKDGFLKAMQGVFKGDDGYSPVKGQDYFTPEETNQWKKEILAGATPEKFKDYFTEEELTYIMAEISRGLKESVTPVKGVDYKDGKDGKDGKEVDEEALTKKVLEKVPLVKELQPEEVIKKINLMEGVIEATAIKGIVGKDEIIKEIKRQKLEMRDIKGMPLNMSDMRWHGGGISNITGLIQAGTNITLTGAGTATSPYIISSSGSSSPLTTKGDLYTYSTVDARLGVGSNGQVLSADSTQATGLKWIAAPASGLTVGTTAISSGTDTRILYDNAGTLGEYTISGSGTVVAMATAPTFGTSITGSYLTASQILITDGSKNIISADTATYPSLTELSYVKGVTSSIQTQLNAKGTGTVTSVSGTANRITSTGGATPVIDISAAYVGQTSITTLGTITTGIWNGTKIGLVYGGTNADLSGTGGTSQVLKQTSVGGAITVAQLAASDLSNGVQGSGAVVLATSPTITTAALGSSTATTQTPGDNSTKLATTAYVANAVLGQNFKEAVGAATTANLVGVYLNGASGVGATFTYTATGVQTIDGITLTLGMRVLLKNQTSSFQNGIYTVTTAGAIGIAGILTRATDADQATDWETGDSVFVSAGTTLATTTWAYTGIDSPVIGTDAITFAQTAGQGSFTAGNGISITGVSIAIDTSVTLDKTTVQTGISNKTFVAPVLGAATATSINGLTISSSTGTLSVTNGKTLTVSDSTTLGTNAITLAGGEVLTFSATNALSLLTSGTTVMTFPATTDTVVVLAATQTLTNKFITPQVQTVADAGGTLTAVSLTNDMVIATALSQATLIANPSGSPVQGEKIMYRLKDNGTARALTYGNKFRALGASLPSSTVISKTLYLEAVYNSTDTKWDVVAVAQEQ